VTTEGALREGPGEVRHTGEGTTWIGPFSEELAHPGIAAKLMEKLKDAGISIEWENRIVRRIWEKVMVNCAINPLTALLRIPNGGLLHSDDARFLMKSIVEEAVSVARAEGIALEAEDMLKRAEEVCRKTAVNRSSMLQDVERGRLTEIDWINGEVVRRGARAGIETPVNQTLVRLIHLLEMRRDPDECPPAGSSPS
jgi:2-dehydropantoate 2-reductase